MFSHEVRAKTTRWEHLDIPRADPSPPPSVGDDSVAPAHSLTIDGYVSSGTASTACICTKACREDYVCGCSLGYGNSCVRKVRAWSHSACALAWVNCPPNKQSCYLRLQPSPDLAPVENVHPLSTSTAMVT